MSIDPNAFLLGSGAKSASFNGKPPITYSGAIVAEPKVQQQTDLATGDGLSWPNGDPKLQLVVQIQTDERDPSVDNDDGVRALYIKAASQKAVAEAVRKAGAKGLEVGGVLSLTYTHDGEAKQRGFNPPKMYTATYQPPTAAKAAAFLNSAEPADPWAAHDDSPEAFLRARGIDPKTFGNADLRGVVAAMKQSDAQQF